jgi:transforming growth factor-beta-induced protein
VTPGVTHEVETLSNRSARLTVFAPTNQAFADLLASLGISSLDAVDAETVKAILLDQVLIQQGNGH